MKPCAHTKTPPVVSRSNRTIAIRCDDCGTFTRVACPFCRLLFSNLDRHQTAAPKCRDEFLKLQAANEQTDRMIAARKAMT